MACKEVAVTNRHADWFRQAEADLRHAQNSLGAGDYEWACFAAHQAAEKALKAVFLKAGMDAWGHTLTALIGNLPENAARPGKVLIEKARMLDKFYIQTRYPYAFDSGAPTDYYIQEEAQDAISYAQSFLKFYNG